MDDMEAQENFDDFFEEVFCELEDKVIPYWVLAVKLRANGSTLANTTRGSWPIDQRFLHTVWEKGRAMQLHVVSYWSKEGILSIGFFFWWPNYLFFFNYLEDF